MVFLYKKLFFCVQWIAVFYANFLNFNRNRGGRLMDFALLFDFELHPRFAEIEYFA